jgi:phosphatidylethanolamine N-methyltransferase
LFFFLPRSVARWFFGLYFAFWRLSYDAGLGYVLRKQSETRWIVKTVARNGWFDLARQPKVARWVRGELEKKMGNDFDFEVSRLAPLVSLYAYLMFSSLRPYRSSLTYTL